MSLNDGPEEPFKDLFTMGEFAGILNLSEEGLTDVVSHRKDAEQEVKNVCREMNNEGRSLYSSFITNVGKSIYPLIVATDAEPGFSGVGSTFTLLLENGKSQAHKSQRSINECRYTLYSPIVLTCDAC